MGARGSRESDSAFGCGEEPKRSLPAVWVADSELTRAAGHPSTSEPVGTYVLRLYTS
jgi:hypothetical protein